MADDIDIEEHDVFDNPQIQNMFPDLTRIKTEVLQEEDDFPYEDYADYNASVPIKIEPRTVEKIEYPQIGSKIILGSKPCPATIIPKMEHKEEQLETRNEPNITLEKENLDAYVLVEDWGPMLENSSCFCKECLILFDTTNTLDAHKAVAHSLLTVIPSVNKAVKSTAKSSIDGLLVCNHCNKKFPDNSSLIKHLYMVMNQPKTDEKTAVKTTTKVSDKFVCYKCTICTSYYMYPNDLKSHVASNHRVNILNATTSVFNKKCAFCPFQAKDISNYNYHLMSAHSNICAGVLKGGKLINYKCTLCSLLFESDTAYYKHKAKMHAHLKYKHLCKKVIIDLKTFFLRNTQAIALTKDVGSKEKAPVKFYNNQIYRPKQVPISYLFKCANCSIYLLSGQTAKAHLPLCPKVKNYKSKQLSSRCPKCPRNFRVGDMALHEFQHTLTNNFKVMTINNGKVTENFMYECGLCHVVVEANNFQKHTEKCDGSVSGQFCPYCKMSVSHSAFLAHVNKHMRGNHRIIKCVPVNLKAKIKYDMVPQKRKMESEYKGLNPQKKLKTSEHPTTSNIFGNKLPFYYCHNCECVTIRKKKNHSTGKCVNVMKKLCTDCGLNINIKKGNHAKLHASSNFTLHDIDLYDYDDNIISIPMSTFYQCESCEVRFVSRRTMTLHTCNDAGSIKTIKCDVCHDTFEYGSFKVHYAFHEVNAPFEKRVEPKSEIPDLLIKYESLQAIWNILYQCAVCSTVTDSYDVAVEHSQAHYSQMESFGVILQNCDICKLAFKSDCYQKHKELHQGAKLNRESFNIVQFNYLHLHSAKWFEMFRLLEPKILDLILSTSMYKDTRSVRMKMLQDGNNGDTMYLCVSCNRIVDAKDVKTHAFNENLCSDVEYSRQCTICQYKFASEAQFNQHSNGTHGNIKAYRILVFNSEEDQVIITAMRNNAINEVNPRSENPRFKTPKLNTQGKYTFYRCINCKMAVSTAKSMLRHRCMTTNMKKRKCPYCNLVILKRFNKKHFMLHRKVYGLNANKIQVEEFTPRNRVQKTNDKEEDDNEEESPQIIEKIKIKLFAKRKNLPLFRCIDCDICFFNSKAMNYHFNTHDKKLKVQACDECGLRFKVSALGKHSLHHHKVPNLKRSDFDITSSRPKYSAALNNETDQTEEMDIEDTQNEEINDTANKTEESDGKADNRALYQCYLCSVHSPTLTQFQKHLNNHSNNMPNEYRPCKHCGLNFTENYCNYHENQHLTTDFDKIPVIKNAIAWCDHCKVFLQNFSAYISHKFKHSSGFNFIPTAATKCETCKLNIATCNYTKHVEYFHVKNKIKLKDYYIMGDNIPKLDNDFFDQDSDRNKKTKKIDEIENILYKCIECSLHLVDKTNHCHKDKTQLVGRKCGFCKIYMLESHLDKHLDLHHKQPRDTIKMFTKTLVPIYKCPLCNLCSHDFATIEYHMKNHNRRSIAKIVTHTCDVCGHNFSNEQYRRHVVDFHKKVDEKREEIQIVECHINDIKKISVEGEVPTKDFKKYKVKFYKCGDCNVCFLSQAACYRHVMKHVVLDSREYIECKICNLQFSIMIFHKHMKKHHIDDNFNLKDVLVEEYRPQPDGPPNIELYYAVDRVQSELVSTTSEVTQSNTAVTDDNNGIVC